jgi:hypothetical protein
VDIQYFEFDMLPGVKQFRCERMLASLSMSSCANNWRLANDLKDTRREGCHGCPIGALHAGESDLNLSSWRGALICARCHRRAARLIKKHLCVSCANRSYEYVKGKNGKGTKPVGHPPMHRRSISYSCDGELKTKTLDMSVDADELIVAVLRDERQAVTFQFRAPDSLRQLVEGMEKGLG